MEVFCGKSKKETASAENEKTVRQKGSRYRNGKALPVRKELTV